MREIMNDKIREHHLGRKAIVYIRQSSERQVQRHVESGHLQYGLTDRAGSLGWPNPIIIDEDLG